MAICLLLILASCRKEGCMDINSASYDPQAKVNDGICAYRYLKSISISKIPGIVRLSALDQGDPGGVYPDLQFRLTKAYPDRVPGYYDLETTVLYNVTSPVEWEVTTTREYLLSNMHYYYELVDIDRDGEEIIFQGYFIPSEVYRDKKIFLNDADYWYEVELTYQVY